MLGRIFGGKKEPAVATPQESISKLRETKEMLMKKQEFLEKKIQAVSNIIYFIDILSIYIFRKQQQPALMHLLTNV